MHPFSPITSTNLVLLFHTVPSMNLFRKTLRITKSMYKFISIEDIELYFYNNKSFNNCCHICFDDGDRTVYDNAFPVLKEMNVPATLFVSPKMINDESNYWFQEVGHIQTQIDDELIKKTICGHMNCKYIQIKKYKVMSIFKSMKLKDILQVIDIMKKKYGIRINKYNITKSQLLELNNSNLMKIGAHTMNHPILKNETDDDAEKEIRESIEKLSKMLDRDIEYFAYPNGKPGIDYTLREQLILKENKIKLAFNTNNNYFNNKINTLNIPRSGFSGLKIEESPLILGKLCVIPIWDNILDIISMGKTEIKERGEIKKLSIF